MIKNSIFLYDQELDEGFSQSRFKRQSKKKKLELMVRWFNSNYVDPVHNSPYITAEGGYQYIHGGPYDARDELGDMFGSVAADDLIETAAIEVESDGTTDWTKDDQVKDWEDIDHDEDTSIIESINVVPDLIGESYGSKNDHQLRQQAIEKINNLRALLADQKSVGIGHNHPPETIDDPTVDQQTSTAINDLVKSSTQLQSEFENHNPSVLNVKKMAQGIFLAAKQIASWTGKKIEVFIDATLKSAGAVLGPIVITWTIKPTLLEHIRAILLACLHWLTTVTGIF